MKVHAEIEVVVRIPGFITIDEQSYLDWLDGNPHDDDSLLDYLLTDPDWAEGSEFAAPSAMHEVIESELVAVGQHTEAGRAAPTTEKEN